MDIQQGDNGPEVERLQQALQEAGFPVDVDGDFGGQTKEAVEAFQSEQGLVVDGIAGHNTLVALGLESVDADEPGSGDPDPGEPATDIEFDEEVIPPEVQQRIATLATKLSETVDQTLNSAELAVENFETTMQFSSNDATASVPAALMAEVLRAVADQLAQRMNAVIPTFDQAVGFAGGLFGTVVDNLAEAGSRAENNAAGSWITSQRVVLDEARREFAQTGSVNLASDLESDFLGTSDRRAALDGIVEATNRLSVEPVPGVSEFEAQLYERWINEHFVGIGDDQPGCVEYRYEFDDNTFDFVSCTVDAPFGSALEAGLNNLFSEGLVPRAPRPLELRVRKRACFLVDNVNPGGKSWICGWIDEQGNELSRPVNDAAEQAFDQPIWRNQGRFVRAE